MYVGLLQFELLVRSSESLKDKRRVVKSLKDRLHREHLCAVAEVSALDHQKLAVLGLSVVSNAAPHVSQTLDAITAKIKAEKDAELGETHRMVAALDELRTSEVDEAGDPKLPESEAASLQRELLARGATAEAEARRDAAADGGSP